MHCPSLRLSFYAACLLAALALCLPAPAQAATLTVPAQYPTLQAAVTAAASGDTVLVADGTYSGPGNHDIDFGGKSLTVASQNGAASTIIDCQGSSSANHRGFYLHSGETSAVIRGLTIKNGYDSNSFFGSPYGGKGAGIAEYKANLTVQNCTIKDNTADGYGGGIYNENGTLAVTNCTFTGNAAIIPPATTASSYGGGIYNENGTLTVTNCTFTGNAAMGSTGNGGGISTYITAAGDPVNITGCTFTSNSAPGGAGGGVSNYTMGGSITITGCTFTGNSAGSGGGMDNYNNGSGTTMVNSCTFTGNSAGNGGGLGSGGSYTGLVIVTNCTLAGNTASISGGGMYNTSYSATTTGHEVAVTNCTLTANSAPAGTGGGMYNHSQWGENGAPSGGPNFGTNQGGTGTDQITLTNDIVYGDTGGEMKNVAITSTPAVPLYCDVQGGYAGTGNIDADPRFVYPPADLHLRPGSPCLGAGTSTGAPTTDKDGNTRPNPPSIGAYELAPAGTTHVLWDNTDGRMSLWNYSTASGTFSHQEYGPYSGYTAQAIADGPDGRTRILWDRSDGIMSVWSLDNAAGAFSHHEFGPYSGYTAIGVSAGY